MINDLNLAIQLKKCLLLMSPVVEKTETMCILMRHWEHNMCNISAQSSWSESNWKKTWIEFINSNYEITGQHSSKMPVLWWIKKNWGTPPDVRGLKEPQMAMCDLELPPWSKVLKCYKECGPLKLSQPFLSWGWGHGINSGHRLQVEVPRAASGQRSSWASVLPPSCSHPAIMTLEAVCSRWSSYKMGMGRLSHTGFKWIRSKSFCLKPLKFQSLYFTIVESNILLINLSNIHIMCGYI